MEIYFLRHGRSLADDEGKIESRYDAPLTQIGLTQAEKAAEYFAAKNIQFGSIVCSTLERARQTAVAVAKEQSCTVECKPVLSEFDRGVLCGLKREDADKLYPKAPFRDRFGKFPECSGESHHELKMRVLNALQQIISEENERVLVVSHGRFLHELLSEILGMPMLVNEMHGSIVSFGDCEYAKVVYKPQSGTWVLKEKRLALLDEPVSSIKL